MSESARDEAIRIVREAVRRDFTINLVTLGVRLSWEEVERLIALSRQRPGWKWVPEEPSDVVDAGKTIDALRERVKVLEGALELLLAYKYAEDCQECAIGRSEPWLAARAALAVKP